MGVATALRISLLCLNICCIFFVHRESMRIDANRCKSMRIDANRYCRNSPQNTHSVRPMRIDANRCESMQIDANRCKSMQNKKALIDANRCTQIDANRCIHQRSPSPWSCPSPSLASSPHRTRGGGRGQPQSPNACLCLTRDALGFKTPRWGGH